MGGPLKNGLSDSYISRFKYSNVEVYTGTAEQSGEIGLK
jgi:hypothetical protein